MPGLYWCNGTIYREYDAFRRAILRRQFREELLMLVGLIGSFMTPVAIAVSW